MFAILLLIHVATAVMAVEYKLTCSRENARYCDVVFFDEDGEQMHSTRLERDEQALISPRAIVEHEGTRFEPLQHQPMLQYHAKLNDKGEFAVASLDKSRQRMLRGVFFTANGNVIEIDDGAKKRRRRLDDAVQNADIVLKMPGSNATTQGPRLSARLAPLPQHRDELGIFPFFPNCYLGDTTTHVFEMQVVYDWGLFHALTSQYGTMEEKIRAATLDLESLFAVGKLVFLAQLNVRLQVTRILFGAKTDPAPLFRAKHAGTCINALGAHDEMLAWNAQQSERTGFRILLSECFTQITGTSYIGNACSASRGMNANVAYHSWLVAFHELGHAFGMSHSFENGQGATGGIMDYGDGKYQGVNQFHPNKASEVCGFLSQMRCTEFFYPAPLGTSCGDGVLVAGEACECLVLGETNCGKCQNCALTKSDVECSAHSFVLRTTDMPDLVIVQDAHDNVLADPACCTADNKFVAPKTLCGEGLLNVCSIGKCVPICTKFLSWNNPNCGFDDTGCNLGCVVSNSRCRFDLFYNDEQGLRTSANYLPVNTACYANSGTSLGKCRADGTCHQSDSSTTARPSTQAPAATTKLTSLRPTKRPTSAPSNSPTTSLSPTIAHTLLDNNDTLAIGGAQDAESEAEAAARAQVALLVGAVAAAILVLVIAVVALWRRRRRQERNAHAKTADSRNVLANAPVRGDLL